MKRRGKLIQKKEAEKYPYKEAGESHSEKGKISSRNKRKEKFEIKINRCVYAIKFKPSQTWLKPSGSSTRLKNLGNYPFQQSKNIIHESNRSSSLCWFRSARCLCCAGLYGIQNGVGCVIIVVVDFESELTGSVLAGQ